MLLNSLPAWSVSLITKFGLRQLSRLTADAFGSAPPDLRGLSARGCLQRYADYTSQQAARVIDTAAAAVVRERLFQNARRLGSRLRWLFHLTDQREVLAASQLIYRLLEITMSAREDGAVTISRCFFSQYYSGATCRLISALDEGMAAGLSGGGALVFHERLTDGSDCCRASFALPGARQ